MRITAARRSGGGMVVTAHQRGRAFEAWCRLIIDAEGAAPRLPPSLGLSLPRRHALGLQYQMRGVGGIEADTPELFFGRIVAVVAVGREAGQDQFARRKAYWDGFGLADGWLLRPFCGHVLTNIPEGVMMLE